jgi:hypothetical protein
MQGRLPLAGATLVLLVALIAGVLLLRGGGEKHTFTAAPAQCVDSWNRDQTTVVLGQHQATYHHYSEVEVLLLDPEADDPVGQQGGGPACTVVFAASSLDSELAAAAMIEEKAGWRPLSGTAAPERLADLQAQAQSAYNAHLTLEGRIEPL